MADTNNNMNMTNPQGGADSANQTMQHEQAKAAVSGDRQSEQSRGERGAIGGGENRSETGEPGRARSELDQDKSRGEFDKSRSEPSGR